MSALGKSRHRLAFRTSLLYPQQQTFHIRTFRELNPRQLTRRKIRGLPNEITPLPKHQPSPDTAARSVQPAEVGCI